MKKRKEGDEEDDICIMVGQYWPITAVSVYKGIGVDVF